MSATSLPRTFAFDFDGVIGIYHGFQGENNLGEPNLEVVSAMKTLKERGNKIIIFSTHGDKLLKTYCALHDIPFDYINKNPDKFGANIGKPVANVYIDDRGYCYRGQNSARLVNDLEEFQPHWKSQFLSGLNFPVGDSLESEAMSQRKIKTCLIYASVFILGMIFAISFGNYLDIALS